MRRLSFFRWLAFAAPLAGCTKQEPPAGPQIIYAGLGVSNRLEVGMTLHDAGQRNDDLHVEKIWKPDTWPWEKPFQQPRAHRVTIPSLGADIWMQQGIEGPRLTMLTFPAAQLPPTILRNGTNEISFQSTNVPRSEVVRVFGEPAHHLNSMSNLVALFNRGESASVTNAGNAFLERLYYPAHGVTFELNQKLVESLTITKKFGGTNAAARP